MRIRKMLAVLAAPTLLAPAVHAAQSGYPDKPIRLVIGSAAGSGPDIISRVLAERLYAAWGQRIVVDPRPGVGGILSAELVSRSAADGYTWMMLTSQLLVSTGLYSTHKINLEKEFASLSLIGTVAFVQVVNPQVQAKSVSELIELARKKPDSLRYGSSGPGSTEHLCGFMLTHLTRTRMLHVPYKGIAQAIGDTVGGEIHVTHAVVPTVLPMIQAGRLRALGVTSAKRSSSLPDVPAIAETVPGYDIFGWYSLVTPTGTPREIVTKVSAEVAKAVREPEIMAQLKNLGIEIVGNSPVEFDAFRRDQTKRMSELVKASGVDLK